jgi:hypothetical protein
MAKIVSNTINKLEKEKTYRTFPDDYSCGGEPAWENALVAGRLPMPNRKQAAIVLRIPWPDYILCLTRPGFTSIASSHIPAAFGPGIFMEAFPPQNIHGPSEKHKSGISPFSTACRKGICLDVPPRTE